MGDLGDDGREVVVLCGEVQDVSRRLVTTVHARIGRSPALNAWHDAFHASTEALLRGQLERRIDPAMIDAEVKIAVFTVEGLLTHELEPHEQRGICEQLAARWPAP